MDFLTKEYHCIPQTTKSISKSIVFCFFFPQKKVVRNYCWWPKSICLIEHERVEVVSSMLLNSVSDILRLVCYGKTQKGINEDGEEWTAVGGLLASCSHVKAISSRLRGRSACHLGPCRCLGHAVTKFHIWVPGPTVARFCIDVHGSCCHWPSCLFHWSRMPPGAVFGSRDNAATGGLLTPGFLDTTRPRLPQRTMSGSMVLSQPRSLLISMAHVAIINHMKPRVWPATCSLVGV